MSFSVRYLDPGESRRDEPLWVHCLPDLSLRAWPRGDGGYLVEHADLQVRSLIERSLLAGHLAGLGGVVLHSSALSVRGLAYLFVGTSGVGKSTIARNSHHPLVSGDTVVVTHEEAGFQVRGTAYGRGGTTHDPRHQPVGGLCFLAQSPDLSSRRMEPAGALSRLFPALFLPPTNNGDERPSAPRAVVETLMELVSATPCWQLAVPLGYGFDPADLH